MVSAVTTIVFALIIMFYAGELIDLTFMEEDANEKRKLKMGMHSLVGSDKESQKEFIRGGVGVKKTAKKRAGRQVLLASAKRE